MLSIFLLLQKNSRKLEDLLLVGYTPTQVSRPYQLLSLGLNLAAFLGSVPVILWVRARYLSLEGLFGENYVAPGIWTTLWIGLLLALVVTAINAVAIRRKGGRPLAARIVRSCGNSRDKSASALLRRRRMWRRSLFCEICAVQEIFFCKELTTYGKKAYLCFPQTALISNPINI